MVALSQPTFVTAFDALRLKLSILPLDDEKRPPATGGKKPDGSPFRLRWKRYQTQLPSIEQIKTWEQRFHPPIWGIVTGALSGVIVLDYDGEQGNATGKRIGFNPHVITGSGGHHQYFQHPGWRVKTLNHETSKDRPWS